MKQYFNEHPKAPFWSKKNSLLPENVARYSRKKFLFYCECGHEFEICPHDITSSNSWCSYCSSPAKKLCNKELNCNQCFEKSFASHPKAIFWSNKNTISPHNIFKHSHKKFWFNCNECNHEFESIISDISNNNSWCSYCSNPPRKLCDKEIICIQCFDKSFASVIKSKYWSNKNILTPREVFKNSAKMYCFNCDKCENEFEIRASHVNSGVWCSKCRYKTEEKFYSIIKKIFPTINSQVKFEWCKKIKHLIFDFVIEERKLIIEVDGIQHFEQVSSWKSPEHNKKNDLIKMKCANDNGYSMIRILQDDIFFDRYDWLKEIIQNIEIISIDNRVQNLYMCKKDEYKDFMLSKI